MAKSQKTKTDGRARGRKYHTDRRASQNEINHKFRDAAASIDKEIDEARSRIDWDRRNRAEAGGLVEWVKTYCVGLLLDEAPPPNGESILRDMERATTEHGNFAILMGRGGGKSSYVLCDTLHALATGQQNFIVIVSHDAQQAKNLLADLGRCVGEPDTPLATDYPAMCLPFILNPRTKRRQTYKGKSTEICLNASQLHLPSIQDEPFSGGLVVVRGITSGIRGIRRASVNGQSSRPTMVILDDLQDSEMASNPEQVEKLDKLVRAEVFNLGGKTRLSILQTATPICAEDYVAKIRADKKTWKTTVYPSIIREPVNAKLWAEYFRRWDAEAVEGRDHGESLEFYRANREAMDDGAEVFNPNRYDPADGHISALQKLMELRHTLGDAIFNAEYQMQAASIRFAMAVDPKNLLEKIGDYAPLTVPENCVKVVASSDLNLSRYITTCVVGFERDGTAHVIHHEFSPVRIDAKLPDVEYTAKVFDALTRHGKALKSLGVQIDAWAVDANGLPFDAVTAFSRVSARTVGIPCAGFIGKASHEFSAFLRSRLRDEVKGTLLCGDAAEHVKSGTGKKWTFWNSDMYREAVHKSILQSMGAPGSMDFAAEPSEQLTEWAIQSTNERLMFTKEQPDKRLKYYWRTKEPHDALDAMAQAVACFWSLGVGVSGVQAAASEVRRPSARRRRRVRIV